MEPKADSTQRLGKTANGQADKLKEVQIEHRSERGREPFLDVSLQIAVQ